MADLAWVTCDILGTPRAGRVTSSDLDGSIYIQTHILRRFQIQRGKLKIFTVAPNMDKLLMNIKRVLGDLLQFGWFNVYLDPNFEEIPDPKREIKNFQNTSQYG